MARERTRALVRLLCGRRRDTARAPGTGSAALRDHLAGDDVGRPRRAARQPDAEPRGGAVRRQRVAHSRPAPTGTFARTHRPGGARQLVGVALTGAQPRPRTAATGHEVGRWPAGPGNPSAHAADEGLTGAQGRREATALRDEEASPTPWERRLRADRALRL